MECAMQTRGRRPRLVLRIEEEPGPTPETRAKLRPDRLKELVALGPDKGGIDQQQFVAGEEIRAIFDAISALWFRGSVSSEEGGAVAVARHHLDALPAHILRPYKARYLPWMHKMERRRFVGLRWSEIIVGIIVDCHALEDYPEGVASILKEALDAY